MAILELTTAQVVTISSLLAITSGTGLYFAIKNFPTWKHSWPPLATSSYLENSKHGWTDESFGKKYSKYLVNSTPGYNFWSKWVYPEEWWKDHYSKIKEELKENWVPPIFKKVTWGYSPFSSVSLNGACEKAYLTKDTQDVDQEPSEMEKAIWKFCSPLEKRPMSLYESKEYLEYCQTEENQTPDLETSKKCILNDASDEKHILASTGFQKVAQLHQENKKVGVDGIFPEEANRQFWNIKDQWYQYMEYWYPQKLDSSWKKHVEKLRKELNMKTLREYCWVANSHKKKTGVQMFDSTILIEYCGIADYYPGIKKYGE